MKILFLGPKRDGMIEYIKSLGDEVISTEEPIRVTSEELREVNFLVSYGYRHIIKKEVLDLMQKRAINLHISLLPWNRGADPNLWSFLEDTPKGVTIHVLDDGIDTGEILAQKEVAFSTEDTLRTSYEKLSETIEALFRETWPLIREGKVTSRAQVGEGSFHLLKDRKQYEHLLTKGWDTPVIELIGKANEKERGT